MNKEKGGRGRSGDDDFYIIMNYFFLPFLLSPFLLTPLFDL